MTDNNAPANGTYDLASTLYVLNVGGVSVAGPVENTAIAVTNGLFTSMVDIGNAFPWQPTLAAIGVLTNCGTNFNNLGACQLLAPLPHAIYRQQRHSPPVLAQLLTAAAYTMPGLMNTPMVTGISILKMRSSKTLVVSKPITSYPT